MLDLVLASRSSRRVELLRQVHLSFEAIAPGVSEIVSSKETAPEFVSRMALEKVQAVEKIVEDKNSPISGVPVLGADTVVTVDGEILGKPVDKESSLRMLMNLSGATHKVMTGVAIKQNNRLETCVTETLVNFRKLTREECENYWLTGEPADKAGSYAIQGLGAVFVSFIEGSYSNVVGLPLMETFQLLKKFGVNCLVKH